MPEKYNMEINKKVKELRKKRGYIQQQIAEILGMKTSTYSQMERSGKIPVQIILKLADVFNVEAIEIMDPENSGLMIDPSNKPFAKLAQDAVKSEDFFEEKLVLTNREENAIIMLRNLSAEDREKIYNDIKLYHDKEFKR